MLLFRLCRAEYADQVLSGEGGLLADGRWHSRGRRIVYTASSEALAVLELRVHLGRFLPRVVYRMHRLELVDDAVEVHDAANGPAGWNAVPHGAASQAIGDAWLASGRGLALRVPSIHVRTEFNVLINPNHRSIGSVEVREAWEVRFDSRLFTSAT